tara:strand:+ start:24324 stop:25106 length:783 start_codon:yes stop_codon:yes gene_type:complete
MAVFDDAEVAQIAGTDLLCAHDFNTHCDTCHLRALCLPAALQDDEIAALENIIDQRAVLQCGEHLYLQDQPFSSLYAVLSGAMKTYTSEVDGQERVTGCHLSGEIFGFSAIDKGVYLSSARALTESRVCEIPFDQLENLCREIPNLQSRLFRLMSRRIIEDHDLLSQFFDKRPARKRIAAFLLSLSTRALRRGDSPTRLQLPMSRTEVSSYLGVSLEKVCRELSRLEQAGVLSIAGRDITLHDIASLRGPQGCAVHDSTY